MFSVSLGILLAGSIAIQMEEAKALSSEDTKAIVKHLSAALEKQTGDDLVLHSITPNAQCRSSDKCIANILSKTQASEVVFVLAEKTPAAFKIKLMRTSGGGLTPSSAKVDLPRARATWDAFLTGAAIMLFPEGANLTPPIVAAARPKAASSKPMDIPTIEIRKTLPVKKPEPKPQPVAKKPEPKPQPVAKKPEPKLLAVAKKPETKPKPVAKKQTPKPQPVAKKSVPKPSVKTTVTKVKTIPPVVAIKSKDGRRPSLVPIAGIKKSKVKPVLKTASAKKAASKKAKKRSKKAKKTKKARLASTKKKAKVKPATKKAKPEAISTSEMMARSSSAVTKAKTKSATPDILPMASESMPINASTALPGLNIRPLAIESPGNRPWPWLALGASIVSAGVGTYFGVQNQSLIAEGEIERDPIIRADYQDRVYDAGLAANVLFGTAALSAITSAVLFVVN